ncbi:hypothetical protein BYT27DRAFT_7239301 [Phlegmacium glaucopus]|nr:hypothetical protein BYT27DRAFT_7239301 [Phlegmacium glaucopus]
MGSSQSQNTKGAFVRHKKEQGMRQRKPGDIKKNREDKQRKHEDNKRENRDGKKKLGYAKMKPGNVWKRCKDVKMRPGNAKKRLIGLPSKRDVTLKRPGGGTKRGGKVGPRGGKAEKGNG